MGFYCICFQEILIIHHLFPARYHFSNLSSSIGKEEKKLKKFLLHIESWSGLGHVHGSDHFWRLTGGECLFSSWWTNFACHQWIHNWCLFPRRLCMSKKELCNSTPSWKQFSSNRTQVLDKLTVDLFYFLLDLFFIRAHCALVCMPGAEE